MTHRIDATAPVALARTTGALYLVIIVLGLLSEVAVRSSLIVRGDPATTAANITAAEGLFRLGFAGDVIVFLCDVAVAALLYVLLRPVSRTLAVMTTGFRLVGTAIYGVNLLNQLGALLALTGSEAMAGFSVAQQQALALLLLDIHRHGYDLGLVFFALHCLTLGWLLWRSAGFPGVLGGLMGLAGVGYLIGSFTLFLAPAHVDAVQMVYVAPLVGELAFCLWLLIKGIRRDV